MTEESRGQIVNITMSAHGSSSLSATMSAWTSVSGRLMQCAALFARRAHQIERTPFVDLPEDDRNWHESCVLSGIVSAASAVEAYANEMFLQPTHVGGAGPFDAAALATIQADWPEIEKLGPLEKLQRALDHARKGKLNRGGAPFQPSRQAFALRHGLVHFKTRPFPFVPTTETPVDPHADLEAELANAGFLKRPYYPRNMAAFPHHCVSHGCLEWVIRSHVSLLDAFADQIGIPRMTSHTWNFATR